MERSKWRDCPWKQSSCSSIFGRTREGCNCRFQKKTPRTGGGDKVHGSVGPRFPAGLPFPMMFFLLRAARWGGFKRGGFPIWTWPSGSVLFLSFLGLADFIWMFRLFRDFSALSFSSFLAYESTDKNIPERVCDTRPFPKWWGTPGFGNPPPPPV